MLLDHVLHPPDTQTVQTWLRVWKEQPQATHPLNVVWLRNVTIEPCQSLLEYACLQEGIQPEITISGYDTVLQEALDPQSALYNTRPDIVGVWCDLRNLSEQLSGQFHRLTSAQVSTEQQRIAKFYHSVIQAVQRHCDARILIHTFTPPSASLDRPGGRDSQWAVVQALNQNLWALEDEYPNVYCLSSEVIQSRLGTKHALDERFWYVAQAPFTREFFWEVVQETMVHVRAMTGRTKKCCIVDCDNTLWGGIVGEDGTERIQIGPAYPGNSFREVQMILKDLQRRGILLAICSKNDAWLVESVLDEHPDMVLRQADFVAQRVNWQDKATNIGSIAEQLNLGLEHIVFIDDDRHETELVAQLMPEVDVLALPEDPTLRPAFLRSYPKWKSVSVSEAAQQRTRWYHDDQKRENLRASTSDITSYLASLDLEVAIRRNDRRRVDRIAELTQRTNQFNLTTQRYDREAVRSMMDSNDVDVLSVAIRDRIGDMGLSACAIVRHETSAAVIDSLLLSCRVLGRGIEDVLLDACVRLARLRNSPQVLGRYVPSKKNSQVTDFYDRRGFIRTESCDTISPEETRYVFDLENADVLPPVPDWFKKIDMELGTSHECTGRTDQTNHGNCV